MTPTILVAYLTKKARRYKTIYLLCLVELGFKEKEILDGSSSYFGNLNMSKDQKGVLQHYWWTPWSKTLALTVVTYQQSWSEETSGESRCQKCSSSLIKLMTGPEITHGALCFCWCHVLLLR